MSVYRGVLSIARLSAGQEDCFLEAEHERIDVVGGLADGPEDYYADPHEALGRWAGAGAARLALGGGVEPDQPRRLFAGAHPTAEIALRATAGARVAEFDLTFSAPKSVSVLFGLGGNAVQISAPRDGEPDLPGGFCGPRALGVEWNRW